MQYPKRRWVSDANCKNVDVEIFFPDHHSNNMKQVLFAKEICSRCVARIECLEDALRIENDVSMHYRYGIFGGMTPKERYQIRKGRNG